MKRRLIAVIWGSAILCTLIVQSPLGNPARALSIDSLIWLRDCLLQDSQERADFDVVVIAVDEATYQTPPFRGTPRVAWSSYLAPVVSALLAANATVIGFDIVLPTSLDSHLPGIDRELLKTLHQGSREERIVLGEIIHGRSRIQPYSGYRAVVGFERNIRPLDVMLDPDGVVRRMPIWISRKSKDGVIDATPSMALELANRSLALQNQHTETKLPEAAALASNIIDRDQGAFINLRRRSVDIPTYSLADLYHCAKAENKTYFDSHFADKIILIGSILDVEDQVLSSARFIADDLNRNSIKNCITPISNDLNGRLRHPTIPGVYLHATMVQSLLYDELLETVSPFIHAVLAFLAASFSMLVVVSLHPISGLAILGIANTAVTAMSTLAFASNILFFFLIPIVGSALGCLGGLSLRLLILERRRRRIRDAFNHLLPGSVVEQLIDRNEFPVGGGKLLICTVFLTDLENYTGLAEQLKPDALVKVLNQVNQALGEIIEHHGGIVSWHAGDSLLALFGAPIECTNHAKAGVEAALDCCSAVNRIKIPDILPCGTKLRLRVGVSTGEMLVGYIGSDRQLTYSAIGDHVNIASRLEGLNKKYGTSVLVNETTQTLSKNFFKWNKFDKIMVKGRKKPVDVFEPIKFVQ